MSKWYTRYRTLLGIGLLLGAVGVVLAVLAFALGWICIGSCEAWPEGTWLLPVRNVPGYIAVDSSGLYGTGKIPDEMDLLSYSVVRKYDHEGNEVWIRQYPRSYSIIYTRGIAVGATGVYVAGRIAPSSVSDGAFPGQTNAGESDAFVLKYDHQGNEEWTRQFGTRRSDSALGIAVGPSGVYVVGSTQGVLPGQANVGNKAFVRKYDHQGNEVWTVQIRTARAVAVGPTGVYVAGQMTDTFPGQTSAGDLDVLVRKFDHQGNEIWARQFGTSGQDSVVGIAVGPGGVYVVGHTKDVSTGQNNTERGDAFVHKYDLEGNEVWTRGFGTSTRDIVRGIAVGPTGVFVAGATAVVSRCPIVACPEEFIVREYDPDGTKVWAFQFGRSTRVAQGIAVGPTGVYVAGGKFLAKIVAVQP